MHWPAIVAEMQRLDVGDVGSDLDDCQQADEGIVYCQDHIGFCFYLSVRVEVAGLKMQR